MLRRELDTQIIIWEYDWIPREWMLFYFQWKITWFLPFLQGPIANLFCQPTVNWLFGSVVRIPRIISWKGSLPKGTPRIPNHAPKPPRNHLLIAPLGSWLICVLQSWGIIVSCQRLMPSVASPSSPSPVVTALCSVEQAEERWVDRMMDNYG